MRNLKKILALVLALMMTLSVMVTAGASNYVDGDQINDAYAEAVEVLTGMGIYKGQGDGSNFAPKSTITRAEASALVYRILTADVKDAQTGIYADYNKFEDVNSNSWYAGYVNFAANGEYIMGDGQGHFYPMEKITGYQLLAIMLRAMGYGQKGEFQGAGWEVRTATKAKELGLTDGITDTTLGKPATREVVAQLLFKAIQEETVVYTPALGYVLTDDSIGWKNFGLASTGYQDEWGRPGVQWYNAKKANVVYATVLDTPVATYTKAVTECDVATDVGIKTTKSYTTYTNGSGNTANKTIRAIATTSTIGAQGRLTEVYDNCIVYIDTYLAQVVDVRAATFDAAGHLKTSSSLTLDVYTSEAGVAPTTNYGIAERVTVYGGSDNYAYTKGQMLLVNAVDNAAGQIAQSLKTYGLTPNTLDILGAPNSLIGAQTTIWYNVEQHTVNGTTYNDAHTFYLDQANTETANHTWYFDQYGNLIGVTNISTQYTYGVISSLWWAGDVTTGNGAARATLTYMDGSTGTVTLSLIDDDGVATGNLGYVPVAGYDATAMTARRATSTTAAGEIAVASTAYINATSAANGTHGIIAGHMFQFETLADGTVAAYKVTNELTAADVQTGVSAITGTGTPSTIYTNSNTVYLVRSGVAGAYTYASVAGYNNIGDYTGADVVVDYVMADGTYARYVYITGTADATNTSAFVMSTGNNYSATLKTVGGISYYEFTYGLNMDGTTNTMKVLATAKAAVIDKMVNSVGKLFMINYTNGFATNATEVAVAPAAATTSGSYSAVFLGNDVTATADALYNADGVLGDADNNTHYNVTNSTVVIGGTLADLATAGKNVYIVYATANSNVVTHIYITNFAKNTVADAQAALANTNYGTLTVYGKTTGESLTSDVLAMVNAKLAAAGVTGVTATLNPVYPVNAPAVGSSSDNWFEIVLSDVFGGTASIGGNYVKVVNENTTAGLSKTIKDHLEGMTSVKANMTKSQVETLVTSRIGQVASTTNLTINVTLPGTMQAGEIVTVVVAGTVNGVVVNTTAQVVVQA